MEDNNREQRQKFYQSSIWRKIRKEILESSPLCVHCKNKGYLTPATDVDHIKPIATHPHLIDSRDNLQPLCKSCHQKKTVSETESSKKEMMNNYKISNPNTIKDLLNDKII